MSFLDMTMSEVLEDLSSRFIINVPPQELTSIQRVCFQIEQAHWYYEDFIREVNPNLGSKSLKSFSLLLFESCPLLRHWAADHERAFETFMEYKVRVPVCGVILLNQDLSKVLLVRGWKATSGWGYPKGKINQGESEQSCAVREVMEEIGVDIKDYIRENDYIERVIRDQRIRLFIVTGLNEETEFAPQTRKEIGDIKWHNVNSLPGFKGEADTNSVYSNNKKYKYYMVTPFVQTLRKWITKHKKTQQQTKELRSAALKVIMDTVSGEESDLVEEGEKNEEYPVESTDLESSLKSLLGIIREKSEEGQPDLPEIQRRASLMDILCPGSGSTGNVEPAPSEPKSTEKKKKRTKKKSGGGNASDSDNKLSPKRNSNSQKEALEMLLSPRDSKKEPAKTDGLLKLLIGGNTEQDPGLHGLLTAGSAKSLPDPMQRKSLLDILEGVPPPPVISQKPEPNDLEDLPLEKIISRASQTKSTPKEDQNLLLGLLLQPKSTPETPVQPTLHQKPPFKSTISEPIMNVPPNLHDNPNGGSLMDILTNKTTPSVVTAVQSNRKPKEEKTDINGLLSLLLGK